MTIRCATQALICALIALAAIVAYRVHFSFPSGNAVLVSEADWKGVREAPRRLTESGKGAARTPERIGWPDEL